MGIEQGLQLIELGGHVEPAGVHIPRGEDVGFVAGMRYRNRWVIAVNGCVGQRGKVRRLELTAGVADTGQLVIVLDDLVQCVERDLEDPISMR